MNKTKIDWCDYTFNPITGCLHGCPYCYARRMVQRFSTVTAEPDGNVHDLKKPGKTIYPFGFNPTFHRYRLDEPQRVKKPSNIFVCSMADLFGDWVPDEFIQAVFEACGKAPQHRYLFLTKNPQRYCDIQEKIWDLAMAQYSPEVWMGVTITGEPPNIFNNSEEPRIKSFLSIEPYLEKISWIDLTGISWVIVGAETGNRKGKIIPEHSWIENIVSACREAKTPLFMKNSLAEIWGEPLIQEYPWEATP